MNTKTKGKAGELFAVLYLKKKHYKIVEQNFRCRFGEIDIIARDNGALVFVEVKTRKNTDFQRPAESVNARKQKRIITAAKYFLMQNLISDVACRFDVIEVMGEEINHITNAFTL